MIWKLSLTGLKSRFKDYLVLFSGLVITSSIFYMFSTLAMNSSFLQNDVHMKFSFTSFIFNMGQVLLSIITLVYVIYANNFLLSMRQKDYGMYMMLGAKSSKIRLLIFLETLVVGVLATVVGIVIGFFLTQLVATLITSQLNLPIVHFNPVFSKAILGTLLFFIVLFLLAAIFNAIKLTRSNIIDLIHEDSRPITIIKNKKWRIIQALLGIVLLAAGYVAMSQTRVLLLNSVWIALITIVIGSYFVFDSLFVIIIDWLRQNHSYLYKGMRSFTLGQLKFRLHDYTRILSMISILYALALGALTVGLNFNGVRDQVLQAQYYDAVVLTHDKKIDQQISKLPVTKTNTYTYKTNSKDAYFLKANLQKSPTKYQLFQKIENGNSYKTITLNINDIPKKGSTANQFFAQYVENGTPVTKLHVVNENDFSKIKLPVKQMQLLTVNNFKQHYQAISKLNNLQIKKNPALQMQLNWTKASSYEVISNIVSGFEFMGFFLSIAFLAMLASTLMFKVLSGAPSDQRRYTMLYKLGTRTKILKQSIRKELLILFATPAILGMIDVGFGLQLFRAILPNPYQNLWIPFIIFIVLYTLYYLLTVRLYEAVALKQND